MEDYSVFLLRAIDQNSSLDDLETKVLVEIAKIFNITVDGSTHNQLNAKLKSKILDLFITEGEQYKDYLELPKFKNLNSNTYHTILTIFHQIWKDAKIFKKKSQMTAIEKQFNYLKPELNTVIAMQIFHLDLLANYKQSKLCPRKTQEIFIEKLNQKPYEFPFHPYNSAVPQAPTQNFMFLNQQKRRQLNAKMQNIQDSSEMQQQNYQYRNSVKNPYNDPYMKHPIPWQPIQQQYLPRNSPFPQQNIKYQVNNQNYGNSQNNQNGVYHANQNTQKIDQQNDIIQEIQTYKNYFDIETQEVNERFRQYTFINCYCQGNAMYESYFSCQMCKFKIHYECFGRSEDKFNQQICPYCMLKRGNMFLTIDQTALYQNYYILKKGSKLQIKLSHSTVNEIKKRTKGNPKQICLRFLKCSGQRNNIENKLTKFDCIPLPKNYFQNAVGQKNITININSSDENADEKQKILVYGLYLQRAVSISDHVDSLLKNQMLKTGENYLQNLRQAKQGKTLLLNIIDQASGQQIVYPVRGDKCMHAQVFDYKRYLELIKQLGKQNLKDKQCDICGQKIINFLLDSYIMQKLQNVPQIGNKRPISILYKGRSDFQWKCDDDGEDQNQNDNDNDDIDDSLIGEDDSRQEINQYDSESAIGSDS